MPALSRKSLREAARLCAQSSACLKKTYSVILDSVGSTSNYDDNGFLVQSLISINECSEKMSAVSEALTEIWDRSKPGFSVLQNKPSSYRGEDDSCPPFDNRYLRKAVNQSKVAFDSLKEVYDLVLDALGSARTRDDNELLYQNLKTIEECKDKVSIISSRIAAINESLEQCELEVLYGPPPFFEND